MSRAPKPIDPAVSPRHRFGFTLRQLRGQAGYSLQGFARRLGRSDSYLSAVELAQARCTAVFAADCERLLRVEGRLMPLWVQAYRDWTRHTGHHAQAASEAAARPAEPPAVSPALPVSNGFVTRLQRERYARGWTQQQAVDRLKRLAYEQGYGQRLDGLDVQALSRYEHGRIRCPRAPLPALFATLYQVPAAVLFPRPARRPMLPAPPAGARPEPVGEPAGQGWVVLTVEELRAMITDATMQAVTACLPTMATTSAIGLPPDRNGHARAS